MQNSYFAEVSQIKAGVPAGTDMNTAAAVGERVSLKKFDRVAILVDLGASTGATVNFTLRQHNAATGGTSKDLYVTSPYYYRAGADQKFTKVENENPVAAYDLGATFGGAAGMVIFEVLSEELDVDNAFTHVSINATDSGVAKPMGVTYILRNPRQGPAYDVETV